MNWPSENSDKKEKWDQIDNYNYKFDSTLCKDYGSTILNMQHEKKNYPYYKDMITTLCH